MTNLNRLLFQELVDLLTPYMADEEARRATLQVAFGNAPVYHQINFKGPANPFTVQLIHTLLQYGEIAPGKQAIIAVLDVIHDQVGVNNQHKIDQVRQKLLRHFQKIQAGLHSCPRCGADNRTAAKFCVSCGQRLTLQAVPKGKPLHTLVFPLQQQLPTHTFLVIAGIVVMIALGWAGWQFTNRSDGTAASASPVAPTAMTVVGTPATLEAATLGTATPTTRQPADLTPLVGIWRISRQDSAGSSLTNWEISLNEDQLAIVEFTQMVAGVPLPGDERKELHLTDFSFDGARLLFTATGAVAGSTETFDLTLLGSDRMEGPYNWTDSTLRDTGMVQGPTGILSGEGKAILVRQSS